ncbi:hypothetical protein NF27_FE00010, partial [Candidatus Jidaibacter acanthamoeba]
MRQQLPLQKNSNKKEIDEKEYKYAHNFKEALSNKDYKLQIESLKELGGIYREKREYTKATALYNTALIIVNDKFANDKCYNSHQNELIDCIKRTEKSFLEDVLQKKIPASLISAKESDLIHKKFLEDLRKEVRDALKGIESEYNAQKEQDENVELLKIDKVEKVQSLYGMITKRMKGFINDLIDECQKVLGSPEEGCKYAIMGLGSIARKEITPYSDFEFAVLINEENENYKQYFRNLTKLLHIKVINLGETVLPTMVIDALNPAYNKDPLSSWFYDNITPNGFKFDGMMPRACKTPLGTTAASGLREGELDEYGGEVFELIHTPKEMSKFQEGKWYKQDNLLPNELTTVTYIKGDKNLITEYKQEVKNILDTIKTKEINIRQERALKLLKDDINKFGMRIGNETEEGRLFRPKFDLYRLPNTVFENLALFYNIEKNSTLDR